MATLSVKMLPTLANGLTEAFVTALFTLYIRSAVLSSFALLTQEAVKSVLPL